MARPPTRVPPDARRFQRSRGIREPLDLVEFQGRWYEDLPESNPVPIPGVRPTRVKELVAGRIRKTKRYGDWIEIDKRIASSQEELLRWCRRHCNDETPAGTFRFSPKVWEERSEDPLSLPFVPEFDHASAAIQELAAAERVRRQLEEGLRDARQRRDQLIRDASKQGHSRRELAEILGISFARVQQLVQAQG